MIYIFYALIGLFFGLGLVVIIRAYLSTPPLRGMLEKQRRLK